MMDSNGSTVSVREMRVEDAEAVSILTVELGYARTPDDIRTWLVESGLNQSGPNRCSPAQSSPNQAAFVACLNGEVVGWIEAAVERRVQSDPYVLIGGLVVGQRARGAKIGRQLCERVETWSWEQGVATVRVTSRSTRPHAHRFYLQNGYETVKTSIVFEKKCPQRKRP